MKTQTKKASRKAPTTTSLILADLDAPMIDRAEAAAASQGVDLAVWVERAIRNKLAEERIQIVFPPAMKEYISELMEACGLTFDDYTQDAVGLIEREVAETFAGHPYGAGILDQVQALYGKDVARSPEVLRVIEKHRGRFPLAEV